MSFVLLPCVSCPERRLTANDLSIGPASSGSIRRKNHPQFRLSSASIQFAPLSFPYSRGGIATELYAYPFAGRAPKHRVPIALTAFAYMPLHDLPRFSPFCFFPSSSFS